MPKVVALSKTSLRLANLKIRRIIQSWLQDKQIERRNFTWDQDLLSQIAEQGKLFKNFYKTSYDDHLKTEENWEKIHAYIFLHNYLLP